MQINNLTSDQVHLLLEIGHYFVLPAIYFVGKRIMREYFDKVDEIAVARATEVKRETDKKLEAIAQWQIHHEENDERRFQDLSNLILKTK